MNKSEEDLEHNTRRMIFNHIVEYPGVSFTILKNVYNISDSTLRYHLKYLERTERIAPRMDQGQLHYYIHAGLNSISDAKGSNNGTSKITPVQERILIAIKQSPGITQTELVAKTSFKRHILTYNISKLIEFCMVRKYNHVRNVCYEYVTDELLNEEILKVLTVKLLNNEIDEDTFQKLKNRLK